MYLAALVSMLYVVSVGSFCCHSQLSFRPLRSNQGRRWLSIYAATKNSTFSASASERRQFLRSLAATASVTAAVASSSTNVKARAGEIGTNRRQQSGDENLIWSPIGSKSSLTTNPGLVRDNDTDKRFKRYPVRFVTYLTRFLLNFDSDVQRWWLGQSGTAFFDGEYGSGSGVVSMSAQDLAVLRRKRFEELAKTVELGLRDFRGTRGETALLTLMRSRYGRSYDGKRQLAILFTFLDGTDTSSSQSVQPVDAISRLIAAADNASVSEIYVLDGGSGYTLADNMPRNNFPQVRIPAPLAGRDSISQATARVTKLEATGMVRHVVVTSSGSGFCSDTSKAPEVTFSPPSDPFGRPARAEAVLEPMPLLFPGDTGAAHDRIDERRSQVQQRLRVVGIRIIDAGAGYTEQDELNGIGVHINCFADGVPARGRAYLDYRVARIEVVGGGGWGYGGGTQPLEVVVEPPPTPRSFDFVDTAEQESNSSVLGLQTTVAQTSFSDTRFGLRNESKFLSPTHLSSTSSTKGLPLPRPAVARAVLRSRVDNTKSGSTEMARRGSYWFNLDELLDNQFALLPSSTIPVFNESSGTYFVSELEDSKTRRKKRKTNYLSTWRLENKYSRADPIFGALGTKGVQRDLELTPNDYLRFAAAGAICTAFIRTVLSPLELVKTQMQLAPPGSFGSTVREGTQYELQQDKRMDQSSSVNSSVVHFPPMGGREIESRSAWLQCAVELMDMPVFFEDKKETCSSNIPESSVNYSAYEKHYKYQDDYGTMLPTKAGVGILFRGADASGTVGLVLGAISFAQVELLQRVLKSVLGPISSQFYELPIFLASTIGAVCVTCFAICPFETARVRLMSRGFERMYLQESSSYFTSENKGAIPTSLAGALKEMASEGGILSLWGGLGPLLLREMLFSLPKFVVFQSSSAFLLAQFPGIADTTTNVDDLLVSLVAGAAAGVAGAIVSSPADALVTRQSSSGWVDESLPYHSSSTSASPSSFSSKEQVGDNVVDGSTDNGCKDNRSDGNVSSAVHQKLDNESIFAGVGVRCIFFAASISVQFLLYDYFRVLLKVSPADLTEGLDVFADRLSFYN